MPRYAYLSLIAVSLLAAGCGSSSDGKKYKVVVIPKGLTHEFWQSIKRGSERAAADFKEKGLTVEIDFSGPSREDEAKAQIDIINHAIGRKVSGIVLAPQHSKTMMDDVEHAVKEKIPVVIIDSGLDNPALYIKYVSTDNYHGGRLAAERLLEVLEKDGKKAPRLVLFRYKAGSESTEQREQGFLDVVNKKIEEQKQAGEPTINFVSTDIELGATKDTAQANARPLLSDKGDRIDGIFAPNESSASGVVEALRSLDLIKKVRLVGFDSSAFLLQALRDDEVQGLIVQDPYRMGYLGVWNLVQYLEGYNVAPDGKKSQSTGEYLVTKDNLDEVRTRELFEPDLQAKRTIETPTYPKR
jgi:ribose transport system substrate-binding protein